MMSNGFEEIVLGVSPHARQLAEQARELIRDIYPAVVEVPCPKQKIIGHGVGLRKMSEHFCYLSVSRNTSTQALCTGPSYPTPKICLKARKTPAPHTEHKT